ncbi:MAG: tRNA 2-thiouridine(34) synthase MnmA [Clostridia bacterium]|nr:tRNA 2-thiouridine(34) synthase MnmA [Clostridia bacterium]
MKFGPFLEQALKLGADYVATGHYCKRVDKNGKVYLYKSHDLNKDQTYFLNQVSQEQLKHVLFPLQDIDKPEVRKIAEENGLITARKKDSTGICFIGERNFRKFLKDFIPMQAGNICDLDGNVIGRHEGVMYYTLGQRRGLNLGGKDGYENDRWFVVKKDVKKNILYVNCGECDEMFSSELETDGFNWITDKPKESFSCFVKCRYRQPDQKAVCTILENGGVHLKFEEKQRAVTPGQYAVLYSEDGMCYGGGEIISCK